MAEARIPVSMNHLRCRICQQVLRDPATVPCGHNFCMRCIQDRWDQDQRQKRPRKCPECGHSFPSRPQLILNTTLANLVTDTQRDSNGREKRKRPRTCSETETSEKTLCPRHNRPLDAYCRTDETIFCLTCASAEHGGHEIVSIEDERKRKQEELAGIQTESRQLLEKQEKKWKSILEQIEEEAEKTDNYCESIIVGGIESLQDRYLSVKRLIGEQKQVAAAQVTISLQTLEAKMERVKKRDTELDRLAQTESDIHFLQEWPSLQRLFEEDGGEEVLEAPPLPFEFTKRAVEKFGKQLEEFCDKEFPSISQIGQNEEPKTRAEFLQYACELTLDPATANEDLVISEGDKEVKLSPQTFKSPSNHCPERFIRRRQVLCREGLQVERCYYEIEVEGDKAEIALTYKRIDRRSSTRLSAFGANANSWSLDRSTKYSVSHSGKSVELTEDPCHDRIGVYLKFKEGTVSFYEVSDSDSMIFLYKTEAKFTEPLYPGFWLGEKGCIRICDLTQGRGS
uniref:tripartite motif-containing protein 16-like protein isoform X2 n=1 Tax=Monopterus albus TaxID=43700 RepID=UPI0009B4A53D|nr:tripartite motif-containing protein 16-like protein isoform X2 [Monopterus albus]